MNLKFHAAARLEAESAAQWYAARSESAMTSFVAEMRIALQRIKESPQAHSRYVAGTRYRLMKRFPYLVVFHIAEESIEIVAIAHARRKPGYWKSRLSE